MGRKRHTAEQIIGKLRELLPEVVDRRFEGGGVSFHVNNNT
jgi:hypothetical protein